MVGGTGWVVASCGLGSWEFRIELGGGEWLLEIMMSKVHLK